MGKLNDAYFVSTRRNESCFFYDRMIFSASNTWELKNQSGVRIKGILQDTDFDFTIDNSFDTGKASIGGGFGDTILNGAKSVMDTMNNNALNFEMAKRIAGDTSLVQSIKSAFGGGSTVDSAVSDFWKKSGTAVEEGMKVLGLHSLKNHSSKGMFNFIGDINKDPVNVMQSKLISALDYVPVFGGSKIELPSINLTTFIFSHGHGELKSELKLLIDNILGGTYDTMGALGLQEPPGGYKPNLQQIGAQGHDREQPGTWKLRVGSHYEISNILITNFKWKLRSHRILHKDVNTGNIAPLEEPYMAALNFSIMNAGFLTKDDLKRILHLV